MNNLLRSIQRLASSAEAAADQARAVAKLLAAAMQEVVLVDRATRHLLLCESADEVAAVLARVIPPLLEGSSGEVMMLRPDGRPASACVWGKAESAPPSRRFGLEDCWSYRQAAPYVVHDPATQVLCAHVPPLLEGAYACVPIAGQGRTWGILHVRFPALPAECPAGLTFGEAVEHGAQVAGTLATAVGLSMARLNARESLHMQAIHDPLTGLYNRRYMEDALERMQAHAEKNRGTFGVVAIDIDRFKPVNDTFGHVAGDALLKAIASLLTSLVRGEDTVCRFGGEEFVILMPTISLDAAVQRAERIRTRLSELRVEHEGRALPPITASLGVAGFPDHGPRWTSVLEEADAALYQAKQSGRNSVAVANGRKNPA